MNKQEITNFIKENLESESLRLEDVRAQKGRYGNWIVSVVSKDFDQLSLKERREKSLKNIDLENIEWADFVTPKEQEWLGQPLSDEPIEEKPLWPEALARGADIPQEVHFPSDDESDLELPIVTTFYSLRGGVGRSTLLSHTAQSLANDRNYVVCIDMDLEAPGLPYLFGCDEKLEEEKGVVPLLLELEQGGKPDVVDNLIKVSRENNLFLLPAGNIGPNYARKLSMLDPTAWYREELNPLRLLLEEVRSGLTFKPDVILIDARTGLTPMSGPLLFELADMAIVVFFPHPQAYKGTELLVNGLYSSVTYREGKNKYTPEVRFVSSPLPAAPDSRKQYEERTLNWVSNWLEKINYSRPDLSNFSDYEITSMVPYLEEIAASDSIGQASGAQNYVKFIKDWIVRFLPSEGEQETEEILPRIKPKILEELVFSPGTAEVQENFLENFVQTDVIKDAANWKNPLVLGRKGSGKTAIFRWLVESKEEDSVVVQSPTQLRGSRNWMFGPESFKEVERQFGQEGGEWRSFWALYLAASLKNSMEDAPEGPEFLENLNLNSETQILDAFERQQAAHRGSLKVVEWLQELDFARKGPGLLVFDGLDSGFGHNEDDRRRRREAIEGLFSFWMDRGQSFENLSFKILLREDIWRELKFENKSHLYGRSVLLRWAEQPTYFKVALKQAQKSKTFNELLKKREGGQRLASVPVDFWNGDDVEEAWISLVGERMKGGKTTFTRRWVWNRLADANDDHTPRHLLQLFHAAVPWERRQQTESPYPRSVIRPRALTESLESVSQEALNNLEEEFHELKGLLDRLRQVGRSPVSAENLSGFESQVDLAQEVGLLGVYEEEGDRGKRYKVPDIYRHALGMTRMGPV